jgi:sulfide:quinone oxidoreductase
MKKVVILGAGTAGTMMAAHLVRKLDARKWSITIIDEHATHYYQPGFLFLPFGIYQKSDVMKPKQDFIPKRVSFLLEKIEHIDKEKNIIQLQNGKTHAYDILIIATGAKIVPDEIQGMKSERWHKDIFDFYTVEGASALHPALEAWQGGELVVHLSEMPIKCPVAPLEFCFLIDWWLTKQGKREKTKLTYVTPLSGAFTKANCSTVLGYMLNNKKINMITDFAIERVDSEAKKIVSYDEKEVAYDLLVTVPTNMGDPMIERSGLGDELNFVPTDKHTLQAKASDNIFVIGDATDVPASKAGSVAHFEADVLTKNILRYIQNQELLPEFDGHANCFIESGFGKAILIDFNYEYEPVRGKFPIPIIGPLKLLQETRLNHFGKMAFRWVYWNVLLRGLPMPMITTQMQKAGKRLDTLKKQS